MYVERHLEPGSLEPLELGMSEPYNEHTYISCRVHVADISEESVDHLAALSKTFESSVLYGPPVILS